jgi:hypothetical protein
MHVNHKGKGYSPSSPWWNRVLLSDSTDSGNNGSIDGCP